MILLEQAHAIAVGLGKSENMRITSGQLFAAAAAYVYSAETDGAAQMVAAGYETNQRGLWKMVVADPAYPVGLGTSFSTGQRVLQIGRAPDPVVAAAAQAQARAAEAPRGERSARVQTSYPAGYETLHDIGTELVERAPDPVAPVDPVTTVLTHIDRLSTADLARLVVEIGKRIRMNGLWTSVRAKFAEALGLHAA